MLDDFLQHVREVLENHDYFRAGVFQLVLEFARRVERVRIDHRTACTQYAKESDRVLQDVRHHDRDAITSLQLGLVLQPASECFRFGVEFAVAQLASHLHIGCAFSKFAETLVGHLRDRGIARGVDFGWDAGRIRLQPGF